MNHKLLGKDFALAVAGQIVSLFGNAILRFSLPLFLLRETGSSALFGMVTACSLLPMILLSLLGGVLADRVNKRNIMVFLDFSTAGIIAGFYFLVGEAPTIPLFIVTLMLLYGISGTYQPAVQASIPVLVAKDHLLTASAVVNQIGSLASLVGPVTGGWRRMWRPADSRLGQAAAAGESPYISNSLCGCYIAVRNGSFLEQVFIHKISDFFRFRRCNYDCLQHIQHPNAGGRPSGNPGTSDWKSHRLHHDTDHVRSTIRTVDLWASI